MTGTDILQLSRMGAVSAIVLVLGASISYIIKEDSQTLKFTESFKTVQEANVWLPNATAFCMPETVLRGSVEDGMFGVQAGYTAIVTCQSNIASKIPPQVFVIVSGILLFMLTTTIALFVRS